jgi:hypothetical protein
MQNNNLLFITKAQNYDFENVNSNNVEWFCVLLCGSIFLFQRAVLTFDDLYNEQEMLFLTR